MQVPPSYPLQGSAGPMMMDGQFIGPMSSYPVPMISYQPAPIILAPQPSYAMVSEPSKPEPAKPAPPAPAAIDSWCSFPITLASAGILIFVLFVVYVTVGFALASGDNTNAMLSTSFCNGYWHGGVTNVSVMPKYTLQGYPTLGVWAGLNGAIFGAFAILLLIEYFTAAFAAIAARDIARFCLALLVVFKFAWLMAGNVWTFDNDMGGSGVIPLNCKNGLMGNRNLYHFCYVVIVIEDIFWPIIFMYTFARTLFKSTFVG